MSIDHSVSDESELKSLTRSLTGYEDTQDELPQGDLDDLITVAAMEVYNEGGSDKWFTDTGLGQALLFTLCIYAKARVENYSVSSWTVGDQTINVQNAGDEDQVQFTRWAQAANDGIEASEEVTTTYTVENTAGYIG
jgi:hypothetical protein